MGLWRIFEIKEIDKQEQFIIEALWRWSSNFLEVKFVTFPLLQPLRWRCVECAIHHERDVREE